MAIPPHLNASLFRCGTLARIVEKFDVICLERQPYEGVNINDLYALKAYMKDGSDVIPIHIEGNNSFATGFMTGVMSEEMCVNDICAFIELVRNILNDMVLETPDETYTFCFNGKTYRVWLTRNIPAASRADEHRVSYERLTQMFCSYVTNDFENAESDYVRDVLESVCGMTKEEAAEIGLGWIWPEKNDV